MSLATALKSGPRNARKGPACGIGKIINQLTERAEADNLESQQLATLYVILEDDAWTAEGIAAEIRESGWDVQGATVARHRRGGCKCEAI